MALIGSSKPQLKLFAATDRSSGQESAYPSSRRSPLPLNGRRRPSRRPPRLDDVPSVGSAGVELGWHNKELRMLTTDAGHDLWVSSTDLRYEEVRLLHPVMQIGDCYEDLLIRGDASHAMTTLIRHERYRDRYIGRVRLCYIDPPFNKGEDFEHYRDSHGTSAWLSLFRDRLLQIRELLSVDGSVWVHLDDSQQHRARCILDEVFGAEAFVATVIWQKRTSRDNRKSFSAMHDYIHVYAPLGPVAWKKLRNALPDSGAFTNPDRDPRGPWRSVPMTAQAGHATPAQFYKIVTPTGVVHEPPPGRCWTYSRQRFEELLADRRIYWPRNGDGKPRLKHYQSEASGLAPFTIWTAAEVGENAAAKKALMAMVPKEPAFDTPKPEALLERIIQIATNPGDIVLDCFLGSGTTAVVADRMGRMWIGIEHSPEIVAKFALPRLRAGFLERVSKGHTQPGEGFTVLDVAPSIFHVDPSGRIAISPQVARSTLAEVVATNLGYTYCIEGLFVGRNGRRRLAVIDGYVDGAVVRLLAADIQDNESLDLAAAQIDSSARREIDQMGSDHRIQLIPEAIQSSCRRPTELVALVTSTNR